MLNRIFERPRIVAWLNTLHLDQSQIFRYRCTINKNYTALNSCFAVNILELIDELTKITKEDRKQWVAYLQGFQNSDTGLFIDPLMKSHEGESIQHNWNYLAWQHTYFCTQALDALGENPKHLFYFLESFYNSDNCTTWLEERDWSNPWLESNNVMFLLTFLTHRFRLKRDKASRDLIEMILDWLDERQDPETGYWGTDNGASLFNGMAGAFHFFFYYFYFQRKINYVHQIIDSTLSLQRFDGLYDPRGGGGPCEDLDAVDILVKMSYITDYRAQDIKQSLTRSFHAIMDNRNGDGIFRWANRPMRKSLKRRVGEALYLDKLLNRPLHIPREIIYYSSWEEMPIDVRAGDLWSNWFRPLALALISVRYPGEFLPDNQWNFRSLPGLGWHDETVIRRCLPIYSS